MLGTLLDKIAGVFERDFLFASFLPALIFLASLLATFVLALGIEGVWGWVESWTTLQQGMITAVGAVGIVVYAYVLHAVRTEMVRFWSGTSNFPFYFCWGWLRVGEVWQRRRYRRLRDRVRGLTFPSVSWNDVRIDFEDQVWARLQALSSPPATPAAPVPLRWFRRWPLVLRVKLLHDGMTAEVVKRRLRPVIEAYERYLEDDLTRLYYMVKTRLMDWDEKQAVRLRTETAILDRRFGTLETVRATELGNVIESYNQYAAKRYKIEAEIFWPRLRQVIKPEYLTLVYEPRMLLDFSLAMASLAACYALLVLLVGPWLWPSLWVWGALAGVGLLVSYFFYRVGVLAAYQFGEMVRASFDLFRLDLMAALQRPHPATFRVEQAQWEEFSKLVVYAEPIDFTIRPRPP
jgi:hypothetical protein